MKMKAAVLHAQGLPKPYAESTPYVIEEVDLEGPGPGEVLVEIKATGVCHTDAFTLSGDDPEGAFPVGRTLYCGDDEPVPPPPVLARYNPGSLDGWPGYDG